MKQELAKVQRQWSEAQTTLEELGIQLSVSKLQVSELQEKFNSSTDTANNSGGQASDSNGGIWTPDSMSSKCMGCNREFSMTRRKVSYIAIILNYYELESQMCSHYL